jgi:hypothetical protein
MTGRMNRWLVLASFGVMLFLLLLLVAPSLYMGVSISSAAQPTKCPPPPADPRITGAAMQRYERGYMIWLQDTRSFYVFYGDQYSGTAETYPDTWQEGMPETDPAFNPPPGKSQPTRGGGLLWRTNQKVRDGLGWAVEAPTGFTMVITVRGDKTWFNGQGYDVFTITGNQWQEHDAWRR